MAKFLNKKEQVIDFQLTPYGKHLLGKGNFAPVYYAFFDDGIIYDKRYTSTLSGSTTYEVPLEAQNRVHERIKNETQYLEGLVMFNSPEYFQEIMWDAEEGGYSTDMTPSNNTPAPDVYRYVRAIGDAHLLNAETNVAPAWKVVALESTIRNVDILDVVDETRIPQINIDVIYTKKITNGPGILNPKDALDVAGTVGPFADDQYIQVVAEDAMFYLEEVNTQTLVKNFDIEMFEIMENTGAKATGTIWFEGSTAPSSGDTITLHDGIRSVTFEWVPSGGTPSGDNTAVELVVGPLAAIARAKRFEVAVTDSSLNISATWSYDTDLELPRIDLQNTRIGVRANIPIEFSTEAYIFQVEGMAGGVDGNDLLDRKYFRNRDVQVQNGYMVAAQPYRPGTSGLLTTGSVDYYFQFLSDSGINRDKACKAAQIINKESYYVDLDLHCDLQKAQEIYYDIYGEPVEPDICLT